MYFEDTPEITATTSRISARSSLVLGVTTYGILTIMVYPKILTGIVGQSTMVYLL